MLFIFLICCLCCGERMLTIFGIKGHASKNNLLIIYQKNLLSSCYELTYPQMKAIKAFFDKYPDFDITINVN